jgi:glycosyltransferase involved in cell wall biosynthesis
MKKEVPNSEKADGDKILSHLTDQGSFTPAMAQSCQNGIKILHVLIRLDPGGVETWLMQVLRNLDRQRFKIDFLVHSSKKGLYDDEAQDLGAKIILCPFPSRPWTYGAKFLSLLRQHGPYQIIHTHAPRAGYTQLFARYAGIPVRIHQCHNDEIIRRNHISSWRCFSIAISYRLVRQFATHGLAVSQVAALGAFGPDWQSDPRWQILPAINDPSPFTAPVNRAKIREDLGIPESAFVIGHVGRFMAQKNHDFLIDLAAQVCRRLPHAHVLLVGDGPLRPAMEDKVARFGLTQQVRFTGIRTDMPRLMRGAMDAFLFPSLYEGMGMVVLEAQAAGLPCLITDTLPEEVAIIPELVRRLPLSAGAAEWAKAVIECSNNLVTMSPQESAERIRGTLFDLEANIRSLEAFYDSSLGQVRRLRDSDQEFR